MHLSPETKESAIRLLDEPIRVFFRGGVVETAVFEKRVLNKGKKKLAEARGDRTHRVASRSTGEPVLPERSS